MYATFLAWPGETAVIKSFAGVDLSGVRSVRLLGVDQELAWEQTEAGMVIKAPSNPGYGMAFPFRIEFEEQVVSPRR